MVYHYRHQGQRWGDPGMSMPANQKAVIWVGVKLLAPLKFLIFLCFLPKNYMVGLVAWPFLLGQNISKPKSLVYSWTFIPLKYDKIDKIITIS